VSRRQRFGVHFPQSIKARPQVRRQRAARRALAQVPLHSGCLVGSQVATGKQRGLGRIGADFWQVVKNKDGQRAGWVWENNLQSLWHSLNLFSHMLLPGPTGPVASTRYEVFREGVQECEARIAIERVLTDDGLKAKLGADQAGRCQQLLDDRIAAIPQFGIYEKQTKRELPVIVIERA